MRYRVAFEHPGQLFDLREMLADAVDAAAATAGITFLQPPKVSTLRDLETFVKVELNLPEDFLPQLMSIVFMDGLPLQSLAREFFALEVPFQIKAPKFFESPMAASLIDYEYSGRVEAIHNAPDLLVVCDEPAGKYTNEVDTYYGLENLVHYLRNKV